MRILRSLITLLSRPLRQRELQRQHYLLATLLFALMFSVGIEFGLFQSQFLSVQPGEADLSGVWRMTLGDDEKFADPNFDDRKWCPIGVPKPALVLGTDFEAQARECFGGDLFPREEMQSNVFWYRARVRISEALQDPSLFLGTVKHRATVYWDGDLLGHIRQDGFPQSLELSQEQASVGEHVVAIRAFTTKPTLNPGIYHNHSRGVLIGEAVYNLAAKQADVVARYVRPALAIFLQAIALLIVLTLLVRMRGIRNDYVWLSLYFSGSALYFSNNYWSAPQTKYFISDFSTLLIGVGVLGTWLESSLLPKSARSIFARSIFLFGFLGALLLASLNFASLESSLHAKRLSVGISILFPLLILLCSSYTMTVYFSVARDRSSRNVKVFLVLRALAMSAVYFATFMSNRSYLGSMSIALPDFQLLINVLTVVVLMLAVEEYAQKQKELAFLGRFVRPGLKEMLVSSKLKYLAEDKHFRGRPTFILKMDVVNHTLTTYQLPYGVKRLFQDLWFATMDRVFADISFLDKNLGDGSIYCFRDEPGMATTLVRKCFEIMELELKTFDGRFVKALDELLDQNQEIEEPFAVFAARYEENFGHTFRNRKTEVRLALAYGIVDEGLWGRIDQAHYDVQGDLVTLVSRLEGEANTGEVVIDENLWQKLQKEGPLSSWDIREDFVQLKGIGEAKIIRIRMRRDPIVLTDSDRMVG